MAVQLGDAFVSITPKWDKLTQAAINRELARVSGSVRVDGDTKPLVASADRAATAVRGSLAKSIQEGVTSGGRAAESSAATAGERISRSWTKTLGSGLGRKLGDSLGAGVEQAANGAVRDVDRYATAVQAAERRVVQATVSQEGAYQRLEKAQDAANKALEQYGLGSEEATRANLTLFKAQDDAVRSSTRMESAQRRLGKAQKELDDEMSRTRRWSLGNIDVTGLVRRMGLAGEEAGSAFSKGAKEKADAGLRGFNPMEHVKGMAGMALAGVGAAGVGSFVKGSFDLAAGFEKQLSGIKAVSGATNAQMDQIKKKSMELGAQTKYSTTEAAGAIEELVKAGLSVPDALGGAAKATTDLAAATDIPMEEAAAQVSNIKNAYQMAAKDLPHIADLVSGAANASAIDAKDFGYSFSQVGSVAKQSGMSLDDTATAIAEMGNMGLKGSDAGTSIKTMLNNLNPATSNAANTMEQYGLMSLDTKGAAAAIAKDHITGVKVTPGESMSEFQDQLTAYYKKHDHETKGEAKKDAQNYMRNNNLTDNAFYSKDGKFLGLRNAQDKMVKAFGGLSDRDRLSAQKTIFGTDSMRASGSLVSMGTKGYDTTRQQMGIAKADSVAATRQQNYASAKEQLEGSLENVRIKAATPALSVSTAGMKAATDIINRLGDSGGRVAQAFSQFNRIFPDFGRQLVTIAKGALAVGSSITRAFGSTVTSEFKALVALLGGVVVPVLAKVFGFLDKHHDVGGTAIGGFIALIVSYRTALAAAGLATKLFQGTLSLAGGFIRGFQGFLSGVGKVASGAYRVAMLAARGAQLLWNAATAVGRGLLASVRWAWSIAQMVAHRAATLAARGAQLLWNAAQAAGRGLLTGMRWAWSIAQMAAHRAATLAARGAQLLWNIAQKAGNAALAGAKWAWSIAQMAAHKVAQGLSTAATWALRAAQLAANAALSGAKWAWSIAQMVAHRVASMAVSVAQKAMAAAQWLVNAALEANPIGLVVLALAALAAGFVYAWKHSQTFRNIVMGAWNGIKTVASDVWNWMSGTLWPGLSKFFTQDIPAALHTFSSIFSTVWNGLKDLAKKPINFVIGTVINGMINGFDKISGIVHGPHIDPLPTLQTGGQVPGVFDPSHRDNVLGVSSKGVPHVRVEPGEFVTNRRSTQKYAPLLHAINRDALPSGLGGSQNTLMPKHFAELPGLAGGGVAGAVDFAERQIQSGAGGWHDRCLAFVNQAWQSAGVNVPWLGADWAIHSWDQAPDKHPKDANAPAGSAVYFMTHNPARHIALGIGNGMVASTDWPGLDGHVGVAGIEQMAASWGPLIGWASPDPSGQADSSTLAKLWGSVKGGVTAVVDYVKQFTDSIAGPMSKLSSVKDSPMGQMASGLPGMLKDAMVAKIKELNPVSSIWGHDSVSESDTVISGNLTSWITDGLKLAGLPTTPQYVNAWVKQAMTESSGDPLAHQQIHDVNSGGNEAQGLLQVIPPTFRQYMIPGHGNIFAPVDNAAAGMNYALHRYGLSGMLGVIGHNHGYSTGVKSAAPGWAMIDERGDEWVNFNGGETVLPHGTQPKAAQQVLVGQLSITNWHDGLATFRGELIDEMDWRASR